MAKRRPAVLSVQEAVRLVAAGDRVFLGGGLAEPKWLLDHVDADPAAWRDVVLTGAFIPGINTRDYSALGQGTRVELIVPTPGMADPAGRVDRLPIHYSDFARRVSQPGFIDWAFFAAAAPSGGFADLGPTADFTPLLAEAGVKLVAIANPALPGMRNGRRIPIAALTAIVEGPHSPPVHAEAEPDEAGRAIAALVAREVRPGDTIELGIGRLQAAMLEALGRHHDLGFHAGMISPPILPLLEAGVFSRGVTTGIAIGDEGFINALAVRDDVRFAPVTETHGPAALARIDRFVAVNSALEIDLWGQANVEWIGDRTVAGVGGLVDFMRGARLSPGGRSILALPATAKGGSVSRIVALLAGPVSVARTDIDMVATEFGLADLRGACEEERARRLVAIAAPAFRDRLWKDWRAACRPTGGGAGASP